MVVASWQWQGGNNMVVVVVVTVEELAAGGRRSRRQAARGFSAGSLQLLCVSWSKQKQKISCSSKPCGNS